MNRCSVCGRTANNMAMISVASGVMREYNVTIKIKIDWDKEIKCGEQ